MLGAMNMLRSVGRWSVRDLLHLHQLQDEPAAIGKVGAEKMQANVKLTARNSPGQNKNNTVLKLAMWLKEMHYFKRVRFVFLIVGHTKNACDRLFNS